MKVGQHLPDLHERFVHVHSPVAVLEVCLCEFVLLDELSVEVPARGARRNASECMVNSNTFLVLDLSYQNSKQNERGLSFLVCMFIFLNL